MNRRNVLKAAIAAPIAAPAIAATDLATTYVEQDGWCSYQWMHAHGLHAYDAMGRKIDKVRAVRASWGGLWVRVIHTTESGAVKTVLGARPRFGVNVVEFEAFVPGGCLAQEPPEPVTTWRTFE